MSKFSWKKQGNRNITPVPSGTYKVEIEKWEECESKKGTPQIRWYATIRGGEQDGVSLVDHTALTPNAMWRTALLVQMTGVDTSNLPDMEVGSEAWKNVLDKVNHRTTYWRVTFDSQYSNNKVEEYAIDNEQEELILTEDDIIDKPPF
jgi:hypothetical protein